MLEKAWEYAVSQGPWAVGLLTLGVLWWRTRSEAKASIDALVEEKKLLEKDLQDEKDARREEALKLQAKGYESISKLVILMDRMEEALKKVETAMVGCLRNGRRD